MWSRMVQWYRDWEQEQLRVLDEPAAAQTVREGWRRAAACKLASMSPIERAQLRDFSLKYRGWRVYAAIGKLIVLFSLCGVGLYLLAPEKGLLASIVVVNVLCLITMFVFLVAYFNYRKMIGKTLQMSVALMFCAGIGALVGSTHGAMKKGVSFQDALATRWVQALVTGLGAGLFIAIPMAVVGGLRNQQYENLHSKLEHEAERDRAARELSEAKLRMLHAQIEPHFLFNTLGAVQQLAEHQAPRAAALTANLITFLRASLSEMRSERVTLAADFGMIDAYLKVMTVRQGERLRFTLDLPPALASVEVPSMMLLTLVENAIKHGIEPSLRGGEIRISAAREGSALHLCVRDTGAGLADQPGSGEGLTNVRTRLLLLYGPAATLRISGADDGGVLAEIHLPLATVESAA
ncbi:sensor histidine kinase [Massilia sp. CF038]|uniref:sensor histidine kinase n=1 Tax=Massilia sp. CF038 TaxID=1881045 RepID=UPI0009129C3F|nr:histidine kinase [Massilia sp. CF038]SHH54836.1 Histidine kinase [Massilia sp. CF038]